MKESGIVRKVDPLGRIVIPKEIRKVMSINEGDPLEIVKENNEILLRKYRRGCIFCGGNKSIIKFREMLVCNECKKALIEA
ncbi:AbrB family transcriptional regulator [Clostridium beijerinckii]|nr:AbrB family transcriptional regulator [Clostridium beijerinckii]